MTCFLKAFKVTFLIFKRIQRKCVWIQRRCNGAGLGILGDLNSLVKLGLCRTACGLGECDKIECLYLKRDRAGIKVTVDKSDLSSKRNELN